MNDKDKKAFTEYMGENLPYSYYQSYSCKELEAWQAACEYKQKEVDELKDQIDHQDSLIFELDQNVQVFMEKSKALQAENAKLRECVEFYADYKNDNPDNDWNNDYAGQVLKELEKQNER